MFKYRRRSCHVRKERHTLSISIVEQLIERMLKDRTNTLPSPGIKAPTNFKDEDSRLSRAGGTQDLHSVLVDTDDVELEALKSEHARIRIAERYDEVFGTMDDRASYDASILRRVAPEQKIFGYPAEYLKQETGRLGDGFKKLKTQRDNLLRELLDVHAKHEIIFSKVSSVVGKLRVEKLDLVKKIADLEKKLQHEMVQSEKAKLALGNQTEQVQRLEAASDEARRALMEVERRREIAMQREREARERLKTSEELLITLARDIEKAQRDVESGQLDSTDLKRKHESELKAETESWNKRLFQLDSELSDAKFRVEQLRAQVERETVELGTLRAENQRKESQIELMRERATAAEDHLNRQGGSMDIALQTLRETQELNQIRIDTLSKERTRRETKLEEVQQEKRQVNEKLHEALSNLDRFRDKEDQLAASVLDLERRLMESYEQMNKAQAALDQARAETSLNTTKLVEAKQKLELTLERTTLEKTKRTQFEKECSDSRSKMDKLGGELNAMRRTLDKLSSSPRKVERVLEESKEAEHLKRKMGDAEIYRQKMEKLQEELATTRKMLMAAETQRRNLLNEVQNLKGNIQVMVRIRPRMNDFRRFNLDSLNRVSCAMDGMGVAVEIRSDMEGEPLQRTETQSFSFNRVLDSETSQESMFDEVSAFVQSALDGYNVCMFAYGQPRSGKTYTMMGGDLLNSFSRGIIPRSIDHILAGIANLREKGWQYELECSYIEIHNETIRDLLAVDPRQEKSARHDVLNRGGSVLVTNVKHVPISEPDELVAILEQAERNRVFGIADLAVHGSKTHSLFTIHLLGKNAGKAEAEIASSLTLCELAGSDREVKSGEFTNTGLAALAKVFAAIDQKAQVVPYKASTLTHILSPCLSGEGKTLMIATVSSDHENASESLAVLKFAQIVNKTEVGKAKKNVRDCATNALGGTNKPASTLMNSLRGRNNSQ